MTRLGGALAVVTAPAPGRRLTPLTLAALVLACPPLAHADATLTLSPAAGDPGTRVSLRGEGFGRTKKVVLSADQRRMGRVRTNRRGRFEATVVIPPVASGTVRLVARSRGRKARRVDTRFEVSSPVGPGRPSEQATSTGKRLRWTPSETAAGGLLELRGWGFERRAPVRVGFARARAVTARVDRSGRFEAQLEAPRGRRGRMPVTVRSGRTKLGFGVSVSADPVIAAAGDIACDPDDAAFNGGNGTATECHMRQTSDLVLGIQPTAVLALGDLQYEGGAPRKYLASYDLSWGRFKDITWPTLGNHEPGSAAGYFDYFGAAVGSPERAFYSFDLGAWHLIALNSNYENCAEVSGVDCALAAVQQSWLRDDLARHRNRCTLAYFHFPRFSSGPHGSHASVAPLWDALYTAGADVVVNGHDHNYERFAPQTPTGVADPNGLREFVVGTGGRSLRRLRKPEPNSEASSDSAFGVLKLVLGPSAYEWEFVSEPGQPFRDRGAGVCH